MAANDQRFQCIQCPKSYKYASGLSRHVNEKHPESTSNKAVEEWFTCKACPWKFATVRGKKIHKAKCGTKNNIAKNFEPLTSGCRKWEKTFSRKSTRDKHQKICGQGCRRNDPPPRPSNARSNYMFTNGRGSIKGLKWEMKKKIGSLKSTFHYRICPTEIANNDRALHDGILRYRQILHNAIKEHDAVKVHFKIES